MSVALKEADPVLGLIAAWRAAEEDFNERVRAAKLKDEDEDAIDPTDMYVAQDAALCARPQTLEGAAAQLIFAAERAAESVMLCEDGAYVDGESLILVACLNAARVMTGNEPKVSERLARVVKAAEEWPAAWREEQADAMPISRED